VKLFDLSGKTALVTGASRGIGLAMAIGLAEAGADIIATASSLQPGGSEVEKQVRQLGKECFCYPCDLSQRKEIQQFIGKIKEQHGTPDILINNAGMIQRAPATEHPDASWDSVIDVNLNAPFILAREFGKDMCQRGSGKIIFTASLLTFQGGITVPGYAASKGAISSLTKALSNEWSAKGVNVNAIAPGYIATDNTEALRNDPERAEAILARIPAGRWGSPDDCKGVTVFLASAASDYVHGSIYLVDGGWMGR
jgi:2-deoxy-D-gluconate 3-dehydrogenase|tara:strand:+ start:4376 stop:5137 length:762 start_codon:yes stop_codon:yes gene_type:complete